MLEPIEWTADGWFRARGGDLSKPLTKPKGGVAVPSGSALSDDFSRDRLGVQWSFHELAADGRQRADYGDGGLWISGQGSSPTNSAPLTCSVGDRAYAAEVSIDLEGAAEGGLLLFYNPKAFVGYSDITALHLWLMRCAGLRVFHGPTVDDLIPSGRDPTMASLLTALTLSRRGLRELTVLFLDSKGIVGASGHEVTPLQRVLIAAADGRIILGNDQLAEMGCSNSFRSDDAENNAVGLLHQEMRRLGSLVMRAAARFDLACAHAQLARHGSPRSVAGSAGST